MGRGAQQQTRQLTDQQLTLQNQMLGQENQQTQQDRTLLMPTISSLLTKTRPRSRTQSRKRAWAPRAPLTIRWRNRRRIK
jgi:hypothetical protein